MSDLDLVPLDDLLAEVLRRCDHGVIALMLCGADGVDVTTRIRQWVGNEDTCVGLAQNVALAVGLTMRDDETDVRKSP